ncbi:hypothetical protein GF327_03670 [Candidatus Woesearchaeota archaeon]|nr:hypothetical protein [Candidatus Woesearchaeota archaeon]
MHQGRGVFLKEKLKNDKIVEALEVVDAYFKDKYQLSTDEVLGIIKKESLSVPISVFKTPNLSSLEIIVKFLKENKDMSYHEIAQELNRDDRTIWSTYSNSKKKFLKKLVIKDSEISIPLDIFKRRNYSVLENIVLFLKEKKTLSYNKIADLLCKHYQTIWTTYKRALNKNEK